MAPRKRVKGKKPTETMRQRQQRLLREQRAARNKNVRSQKALPPKATTGGRRYSSGTASSRRAQAAAKQVRAAQGTKSTTVRQGQPAGAANRYYGADRVARSVRRAQVETAARRFAKGAKVLGKGAARLIAGRDDGSGSALMAAMAANDAINAARGSTAKERNSKKVKPAKPAKPAKRGMSNIPPSEGSYNNPNYGKPGNPKKTSEGVSTPKAKSKAPVAASKPRSAAPKPKATSGKNPYRMPQGAERKDKSYKAVQELKGMVKASKARQYAQMPKKPAAKKKLSKNAQNLRRRRGM